MTDSSRKRLRAIAPEDSNPLSVDDVQTTGNELVTELNKLVLAALNESVNIGHARAFQRPLRPADIRAIRYQSGRAFHAWAKVEAVTSELLDLERRMKGGA